MIVFRTDDIIIHGLKEAWLQGDACIFLHDLLNSKIFLEMKVTASWRIYQWQNSILECNKYCEIAPVRN